MIALRNNPSVLFWEAGNIGIPANQMGQMVDLEKEWDPHGGRIMGCRTLNDPATTTIAEYYGVMIGQDPRTDQLKSPTELFRAYSAERRDRAPLIETEDFRDEGAPAVLGRFFATLFRFQAGTERHVSLEFRNVRAGRGQPLLGLLEQSNFKLRRSTCQMVGICLDLFLRFQRRWPPAIERSGPRERQGRRGAVAEGNLFCPPGDAKP